MPKFDTKEVPQSGTLVRIKLARPELWLYAEVDKVSPSYSFITLKVLGIKESPDEEVTEPTVLKDASDPMGETHERPPIRTRDDHGSGTTRRAPANDGLPPSPVLEVEQREKELGDPQPELF